MAIKPRLSLFTVILLVVIATVTSTVAFASSVDEVLLLPQEPAGVVFEIVSGNRNKLRQAIPVVQDHIRRLRQRFPELDIAIVTHGQEQFSLTNENRKNFNEVHRGIESLVKNAKVPVHVCETYANWNDVEASAFPGYIDVAAAGPAQINDYRKLGYILIKLN